MIKYIVVRTDVAMTDPQHRHGLCVETTGDPMLTPFFSDADDLARELRGMHTDCLYSVIPLELP